MFIYLLPSRMFPKIGEVSKRSGIGVEALRFYEKSELIDPPGRTGGGYRQYDASVLDRLEFIKRAQALGFSLNEVAQIIAEKWAGHSPCDEVRDIVRARLRELDERMAQMRRYRREMADTLKEWDQAGEVDGGICGLITFPVLAWSGSQFFAIAWNNFRNYNAN